MRTKMTFALLLLLVSGFVSADKLASLRAYDEAYKEKIRLAEKFPFQEIEGKPAAFYYILQKYVIQERAIMDTAATPSLFGWKCIDRETNCIDVGMKCQLPAEFYDTKYEREQCQ